MAATPLRIAVVDDHEMTRTGLARFFTDWPHGQVVLEAENGLDYERQVADVGHIHVALVDLKMPKRDGYDTIVDGPPPPPHPRPGRLDPRAPGQQRIPDGGLTPKPCSPPIGHETPPRLRPPPPRVPAFAGRRVRVVPGHRR